MTYDDFESLRNALNRLAGMREQTGPDYPTAFLNLIDALRDYIRADARVAEDLLMEDAITPEQLKRGRAAMQPCRLLLKRLEEHEFDPTLKGVINKTA